MDNALEIHAHYSKLFEAFAALPLYDIRSELGRESSESYKAGHYHEWRRVLQRLRSYLEKSTLDSERYEAVKYFIDSEEEVNERTLPYPECRFPLRETDRSDLKTRFVELIKWQNVPMAGEWISGNDTRTPDEIQGLFLLTSDEETRGRADVIKQRLALLDEWKFNPDSMMPGYNEFAPFPRILSNKQEIKRYPISPHPVTQAPAPIEPLDTPAFTVIKSQAQVLSEMIAQIATDAEASANAKGFTLVGKPGNPVPPARPQPLDTPAAPATTEPLQSGSPALETPVPTVADLCRQPFTPADLNRLLASLNVRTETFTLAGPTYCLSGSLIKKGAVRISKTFAALTELNENGLLNWVGWQAAMKAPPYGLTFGEKVRAYEYKSKNARRQSDTFDRAIESTRRWLNRWRTAYNSQKQP